MYRLWHVWAQFSQASSIKIFGKVHQSKNANKKENMKESKKE